MHKLFQDSYFGSELNLYQFFLEFFISLSFVSWDQFCVPTQRSTPDRLTTITVCMEFCL